MSTNQDGGKPQKSSSFQVPELPYPQGPQPFHLHLDSTEIGEFSHPDRKQIIKDLSPLFGYYDRNDVMVAATLTISKSRVRIESIDRKFRELPKTIVTAIEQRVERLEVSIEKIESLMHEGAQARRHQIDSSERVIAALNKSDLGSPQFMKMLVKRADKYTLSLLALGFLFGLMVALLFGMFFSHVFSLLLE